MNNEEQLRQAMRDLRELSAHGVCSRSEKAILTAFRKHHVSPLHRWKWPALSALAASLLVASVLRLGDPVAVQAPAPISRIPAAPAMQHPLPSGLTAPGRKSPRVRRPVPQIAKRKDDGGFQAIPYAPPIPAGDSLQMIRVNLPADYGRRIEADILSGQDGIARAIRFVR